MGVAILPRLAAIVSSTISFSTFPSIFTIRKTRTVKGTNVISVTSLVMIILQKNKGAPGTQTAAANCQPVSAASVQAGKNAQRLKSRHNDHQTEQKRQSPVIRIGQISRSGLTAKADKAASRKEIQNTVSFLKILLSFPFYTPFRRIF